MPLPSLLLAFGASIAGTQTPELLRLKPVVDSRLEFRMEITMKFVENEKEIGGLDAHFLLAERVLEVAGERITLRRHVVPGAIDGRGEAGQKVAERFREGAKGTYTLVTDHRSQTLRLGEGAGGTAGNTIDVVLPEAPVAPGASWGGIYGANRELEMRYTLRGSAMVRGRSVVLIDLAKAETGAKGFGVEPESVFALDLTDGRWLRAKAGFVIETPGNRMHVRYAIARTGAPEWTTILAAFPEKG